jgi:hypothetical protein
MNVLQIRDCMVLCAIGLAGLTAGGLHAGEGDQPYTPTRVEWLALEMSTLAPMQYDKYIVVFRPVKDADAILIQVVHEPDVDVDAMNTRLNQLRDLLMKRAKIRGWDSWLRIRDKVTESGPANQ